MPLLALFFKLSWIWICLNFFKKKVNPFPQRLGQTGNTLSTFLYIYNSVLIKRTLKLNMNTAFKEKGGYQCVKGLT